MAKRGSKGQKMTKKGSFTVKFDISAINFNPLRATKFAQIFRVTFFYHKLQIYAKKHWDGYINFLPLPHYFTVTD